MTVDHKSKWKCQECIYKMTKTNHTSTPIKPNATPKGFPSPDLNNTVRRKPNISNIRPIVSVNPTEDSETSVDGITDNTIHSAQSTVTQPATLEQISRLLDSKLHEIRSSIISDIRNTIQIEVNNAMKSLNFEVERNLETLTKEQEITQNKIQALDTKIEDIQQQLIELENPKKIILFGLREGQQEGVNDLMSHVSQAFSDILGINLYPYIEDIKRIGKKGTNRPVTIELISKRMTKHILDSSRKFRHTGLAIDEYLNGHKLQERNELRKQLMISRKDGQHAVIKNSKLYVNGKLYNQITTTETEHPNSPILPTRVINPPELQQSKSRQRNPPTQENSPQSTEKKSSEKRLFR